MLYILYVASYLLYAICCLIYVIHYVLHVMRYVYYVMYIMLCNICCVLYDTYHKLYCNFLYITYHISYLIDTRIWCSRTFALTSWSILGMPVIMLIIVTCYFLWWSANATESSTILMANNFEYKCIGKVQSTLRNSSSSINTNYFTIAYA